MKEWSIQTNMMTHDRIMILYYDPTGAVFYPQGRSVKLGIRMYFEENLYIKTFMHAFSMLLLFDNARFSNYWFESATPSFLIKLMKDKIFFEHLDMMKGGKTMALARKAEKKYTYADYVTWPDDERWELIAGEAYDMSPAPATGHQKIVGNFYGILRNKLAGRTCTPFIAPTDVVFSKYDVVQPDVFVVCEQKKITEANIQGNPDVIIEVRSPSTALKDMREKKALYEKFGVKEYIIIDPIGQYIECFYLMKDGAYSKEYILGAKEILAFRALEGIDIPLWEVFEVDAPEEETKCE